MNQKVEYLTAESERGRLAIEEVMLKANYVKHSRRDACQKE